MPRTQVWRAFFCRAKTVPTPADLCHLKSIVRASPAPEAGPSSSRAAPPPAKKAKLGERAELSGENQSGRRRVSSHGTAYLDKFWQHGSTSGGGGGSSKKRTASPDLVLSSDLEGGNIDEGRMIRGMIILDSDEE